MTIHPNTSVALPAERAGADLSSLRSLATVGAACVLILFGMGLLQRGAQELGSNSATYSWLVFWTLTWGMGCWFLALAIAGSCILRYMDSIALRYIGRSKTASHTCFGVLPKQWRHFGIQDEGGSLMVYTPRERITALLSAWGVSLLIAGGTHFIIPAGWWQWPLALALVIWMTIALEKRFPQMRYTLDFTSRSVSENLLHAPTAHQFIVSRLVDNGAAEARIKSVTPTAGSPAGEPRQAPRGTLHVDCNSSPPSRSTLDMAQVVRIGVEERRSSRHSRSISRVLSVQFPDTKVDIDVTLLPGEVIRMLRERMLNGVATAS